VELRNLLETKRYRIYKDDDLVSHQYLIILLERLNGHTKDSAGRGFADDDSGKKRNASAGCTPGWYTFRDVRDPNHRYVLTGMRLDFAGL
jgi:hypothetical protein